MLKIRVLKFLFSVGSKICLCHERKYDGRRMNELAREDPQCPSYLPNIIRAITLRREMRCELRQGINAKWIQKIFVEKRQGKRPLGRHRHILVDKRTVVHLLHEPEKICKQLYGRKALCMCV
jgi:PHP family Zn ribbon phosphoesterase